MSSPGPVEVTFYLLPYVDWDQGPCLFWLPIGYPLTLAQCSIWPLWVLTQDPLNEGLHLRMILSNNIGVGSVR